MAVALGCLSDPKSDNFIGSDWTRMAYWFDYDYIRMQNLILY